MAIVLLLVSFLASVVGAICGIGGSVVIKPVLDALNIASVSTISFLSGCTVLSMSCYSVLQALRARESLVDFKAGTPLAIGSAIGGVIGKNLFTFLHDMVANQEQVGGYQAACLAIITAATLVYTLCEDRIKTYKIQNAVACICIGLVLGVLSSFLGIGGGPINLVILYFFFSMSTKAAAQNSLYIILFSQIASLVTTLLTGGAPEFQLVWLILMVGGGILGGMVGRKLNKRLQEKQVKVLFEGLVVVIIGISCCNTVRFLG